MISEGGLQLVRTMDKAGGSEARLPELKSRLPDPLNVCIWRYLDFSMFQFLFV